MEVPRHIGIIMDGNRRWAEQHRFKKVFKGHEAGVGRIEPTVEHAKEKGIEVVSFWAFSTDNWKRSTDEVDALLCIFRDILSGPMVQRLIKKGVKIHTIGDMSAFPQDIQEQADAVEAKSAQNKNITVNLALNYGGQEEIVFAANRALKEGKTELTPEDIASHLYTAGQPEPDLIIRTGGEQRLSGFMAWQVKNAELYFTDTYWPDFTSEEFDKALEDFALRNRRFGK